MKNVTTATSEVSFGDHHLIMVSEQLLNGTSTTTGYSEPLMEYQKKLTTLSI